MGAVFGSSSDPGVLGTGQYSVDPTTVSNAQNGVSADTGQRQLVNQMQNYGTAINQRNAPMATTAQIGNTAQANAVNANAAQLNTAPYNQDRSGQQQLISALQTQAAGGGPSVANDTLRTATQQNIAGAMAMAASQRGAGVNTALGLRGAQDAAAIANQGAAATAATARDQEQLSAQQQLGNNLSTVAGQDTTIAGQNANLTQAANLQNAQLQTGVNTTNAGALNATNSQNAALQQQTNLANQNEQQTFWNSQDQTNLGLDSGQAALAAQQQQANANAAQLGLDYSQLNQQGYANAAQARSSATSGILGSAGSAISGLASMSDENQKTNIRPGGAMMSSFLSQMQANKTTTNPNGTITGATGTPQAPQVGAGQKPGGGEMFNPATYTQSGGNAQGEAALAARDAHTANFNQLGTSMGDWFNVSNANPNSPEMGAAQQNLNHYFFDGTEAGKANGAGAGMSMSDENQKKDIKPTAKKKSQSLLDAVKAYDYDYKDPSLPGAGEGRYTSVMAQDLEKAGEVGKSMVKDTPNGKMVDYSKALGTMLAGQAMLNERLNKLEGSRANG